MENNVCLFKRKNYATLSATFKKLKLKERRLIFLDVIPEFRMLRFPFGTKSMLYFWVFLLCGWGVKVNDYVE